MKSYAAIDGSDGENSPRRMNTQSDDGSLENEHGGSSMQAKHLMSQESESMNQVKLFGDAVIGGNFSTAQGSYG